jgi:hypothetical protein
VSTSTVLNLASSLTASPTAMMVNRPITKSSKLRAFDFPLGTMSALDEDEEDRQDDYETRHNNEFGVQVLKLFCACSLPELGGDQQDTPHDGDQPDQPMQKDGLGRKDFGSLLTLSK